MKFILICLSLILSILATSLDPTLPFSVILSLTELEKSNSYTASITQELLDDYESYIVDTLKGNIGYKYEFIKALLIEFQLTSTLYNYIRDTLSIEGFNSNEESLISGLKTILINYRKDILEKYNITLNVEKDGTARISDEYE